MKKALLGVILCAIVCTGCSIAQIRTLFGAFDKPTIESIRPRILGLDFSGVNLAFDVDLNNPNSFPIKTPKFKYGLDIQGSNFMKSEGTADIDLPAKGIGTVVLPAKIKYLDIWKTYQGLKDANQVNYDLKGAFVVSPMGRDIELPLAKSGSFPVLKIPSFSKITLEPTDINLTESKVKIKANVTNPNVFEMGLEKLGYVLKMGDVDFADVKSTLAKSLNAGETGQITLNAKVGGLSVLGKILDGADLGKLSLTPEGSIVTPYGEIPLPK